MPPERIPWMLLVVSVLVLGARMPSIAPRIYDWENRVQPIPSVHVFQAQHLLGTQIDSDHMAHVEDVGLECTTCHHVEGCGHCYRGEVPTVDIAEAEVAIHRNCLSYHQDKSCKDRHRQ